MQVVSYIPKILKQGDSSTDYFSETIKQKISFQRMSRSRVFLLRLKTIAMCFKLNTFDDNLTGNVCE